MAVLASAPSSPSHAQASLIRRASVVSRGFATAPLQQPSRRNHKFTTFCIARNLPPEKGRGKNARKAAAQGLQRIMKGKEADMQGWTEVATADDFVEGKNKAIIHDNKGYVLVKRGDELRAIEANCTSCKFPVIEGKVSQQEGEALNISCPLCHSRFSLDDGQVLQYCPKDGPLQWVIGTLKEKVQPAAAKVVPARVSKSGRVYVRFVNVQVL